MNTGVIKRIKPFTKVDDKPTGGYGFISVEGGGDLFFHASAVADRGFANLMEGDNVEFEMGESQRGPVAVNVKFINSL